MDCYYCRRDSSTFATVAEGSCTSACELSMRERSLRRARADIVWMAAASNSQLQCPIRSAVIALPYDPHAHGQRHREVLVAPGYLRPRDNRLPGRPAGGSLLTGAECCWISACQGHSAECRWHRIYPWLARRWPRRSSICIRSNLRGPHAPSDPGCLH